MPENESRIVDLELRFMLLERFAQELSDVVADQGRTIDRLVGETERLRALAKTDGEHLPSNERPPHY